MKLKPDNEAGEGNRKADQRYRQGVRKTVESSDADARAEQARDLSGMDLKKARDAEEDARSHAKK